MRAQPVPRIKPLPAQTQYGKPTSAGNTGMTSRS
jgi:hypothetical protein